MMEVRVRVSISPWTDPAFVRAVEDVLKRVALADGLPRSSIRTAERAESLLRELGYGEARIVDDASIDETLRHIAHWRIYRGRVA